ncbi:Uncharacterised protein [Bordetella pertussis]|nr:Uncharacterised protein [Bordetella pertussis]
MRSGTLSIAPMVAPWLPVQSPIRPTPSRRLLAPQIGSTRYGPWPKPQTPSVTPKSLGILRAPVVDATSKQPPIPMVVLNRKRPIVLTKSCPRPCRKLLVADHRSPTLLNILCTQLRTGCGVTKV